MSIEEKEENEDILSKFNAGCVDGYEYIFKSLYQKLCYFANNIIKDETVSQDIVQDVFVKLWERDNHFESFDHLSAFLFVAVRNGCFNHLKSNKFSDIPVRDIQNQIYSDSFIIENIISAEVLSVINTAIDTLPEECKKIMNLILQGYSMVEISVMLNLASSSVRAQKARAIKLLKPKLPNKLFTILLLLAK